MLASGPVSARASPVPCLANRPGHTARRYPQKSRHCCSAALRAVGRVPNVATAAAGGGGASPATAAEASSGNGSNGSNGSGAHSSLRQHDSSEAAADAQPAASESEQGGSPGEEASDAEQLRAEVSELRQLLIAQGRLVQSQQRHIQQLEAAVGQAVVQQVAASTAAQQAAMSAAAAAAAAADQVQRLGSGPTILPPPAEAPPGGRRSSILEDLKEQEAQAKQQLLEAPLHDRRLTGLFDARYHSTAKGATPRDFRVLPKRIFLVRHAESEGNVDNIAYTYLPDPRVPLTARGWQQAVAAGDKLKAQMEEASGGDPYKLFFYTSPYLRSRQTYEGLAMAFQPDQVQGVQEEVQLREQDFGNFQDAEGKQREKAERLRFGRFFYRFPNGESGADVYDRMTIFEDHLVRDINAGRFAGDTSLVLVTHGLALRIFLMRWFHWTVDQFMCVFNPPNAEPLVLERVPTDWEARQGGPCSWIHTKALYRLSDCSREVIKGCTEDMCQTSWKPRGINPLDPADRILLPDP